jgi:flagellar biosynthetic protein FliQ
MMAEKDQPMTSALASELFHAALWTAIEVGGPLLAVLTAIAVIFGVLQAATQVQDSSVSFTPKVAAAAATVWLGSTWMISALSGFMHKAFVSIPWIVQR